MVSSRTLSQPFRGGSTTTTSAVDVYKRQVGMNASRAYTIRYGALLSIGRVQTPTLALIVEKQKEIDAFVPQDYFEVQADFEQYTGFWIDEKENTLSLIHISLDNCMSSNLKCSM